MSVLDAMRDLFGRRSVSVTYAVRAASVLGMGPTELYRKQPHLRAVVSFLADNVADVPLKCYVREGDDNRPRDTTSPLALLLERPSRGMTLFEYNRAIVSDYLIYDHALGVIVPDLQSRSGWSVRHIPWSWVEANETLDGFEPSTFTVNNPYTGGRATFDAEDCIHYFAYDPRGGMPQQLGAGSPIEALREVLAEQISAWNFRNGVWRNGGRVTQYLTRPASAAPWDPKERTRFAKSWKERFAGEGGTNTGGTPLLEDGMELKAVPFNARESQFVEATKLSREDVAAVYHVNPAIIWHDGTQTYASAKDNARALYAEALSPIFTMIQQRNNAVLVPRLGLDESHYCEFDLSKKLAASFEEQASVLQSSAGGPWITRNEARARMNMPALPGGDELIVPLNVTEGGLASPNDTDPTKAFPLRNGMELPPTTSADFAEQLAKAIVTAAKQAQPQAKALPEGEGRQSDPFDRSREVRIRVKARPEVERSIAKVLSRFCSRQRETYIGELAKLDLDGIDLAAAVKRIFEEKSGTWLGDAIADLYDCAKQPIASAATRSMAMLGVDPDGLDESTVVKLATDLCRKHAHSIAQSALDSLVDAASAVDAPDARSVRALVHDTFRKRVEPYVENHSNAMATYVASAGSCEGARQSGVQCQKEWVCTGHNSRDSHAKMNGVRVGLDELFPLDGGALWPGDTSLPPEETCNCHCRIDIVTGGKARFRERRTRDVARELGLDDFNEGQLDAAIMRCQQMVDCDGRLWEELTPQERSSVLDELRTRDRDWAAFGRPAPVDYSSKPRESLYSHEAKAIDYLSEQHGITLSTILEDDDAVANLDLMIGDYGWELKSPKSGKHAVDDRLTDAFHKFRKLGDNDPRIIICNSESTRPDDDVLDECLRRIRHRKETDQLESIAFLFLSHDGKTLLRYKI